MTSPALINILVDQISLSIKECYHAAPNSLLDILLNGCHHAIVRQIFSILCLINQILFY